MNQSSKFPPSFKTILMVFALVAASLFPAIVTLVAIRWEMTPAVTYPLGKIVMLAIPVIGWRMAGLGAKEMMARTGVFDKKWWVGFPHGLAIGGTMTLLYYFVLSGHIPETGLTEKMSSLGLLKTWPLAIAGLSLFNSAAEEYYWRSFLYPIYAEKTNDKLAVFINGTLFTLHHLVMLTVFFPIGFALLFALGTGAGGMLWAELRRRRISIVACWISHMIVDYVAMTIGCIAVAGLNGLLPKHLSP
jgi:membrane protease YdiL (CAAX protease family)